MNVYKFKCTNAIYMLYATNIIYVITYIYYIYIYKLHIKIAYYICIITYKNWLHTILHITYKNWYDLHMNMEKCY